MFDLRAVFSVTILLAVASACNSNIRHIQRLNPQKCMHCPELRVDNLCEIAVKKGLKKESTCGKASVSYSMFHSQKQNCAKALVHCSSLLATVDSVVIAVDSSYSNLTAVDGTSFNSSSNSSMEINTDVLIETLKSSTARGYDYEHEFEEFEPFVYIGPKKKTTTTATLTCNAHGEWEAVDLEMNQISGIETVHCIVGNV